MARSTRWPTPPSDSVPPRPDTSFPLHIVSPRPLSSRASENGAIDWLSPSYPKNPFNLPAWHKWLLLLSATLLSIVVSLPAGAYGTAHDRMAKEWNFKVSEHPLSEPVFPHILWGLASWNLGAAVIPLLVVPLTDKVGRRWGYIASFTLFVPWLFASAFADSFIIIVVTRFFAGGFSSALVNLVGGTVTDLWDGPRARSLPMAVVGLGQILGIALGPVMGGAIWACWLKQSEWRWIYYIELMLCAASLPLLLVMLKETKGETVLHKRAQHLHSKEDRVPAHTQAELSKDPFLKTWLTSTILPLRFLCTELVVLLFTLWISFAWTVLFLFQCAIPIVFGKLYNFNLWQNGMIQLALCFGAFLGFLLQLLANRLHAHTDRGNGQPIPEARLLLSILGSLVFAISLFVYGRLINTPFTAPGNDTRVEVFPYRWYLPMLPIISVGFGVYTINMAVLNYLTDSYDRFAASALSATALGRNVFAAFLPLAGPVIYSDRGLGFAKASYTLGGIALVLSPVPLALCKWGSRVRRRSPSMPGAMGEKA